MRTFIENYLHFMKNCKRPHYEKLKSLKSGFIENSIFENNRDPWVTAHGVNLKMIITQRGSILRSIPFVMSGHLFFNFFQTLWVPKKDLLA